MVEPTLRELRDWRRRLLMLSNEMQRYWSQPSKLENLTRYAYEEAQAVVELHEEAERFPVGGRHV